MGTGKDWKGSGRTLFKVLFVQNIFELMSYFEYKIHGMEIRFLSYVKKKI
jgi:hypothetical protein